jgi:hypothetical protein
MKQWWLWLYRRLTDSYPEVAEPPWPQQPSLTRLAETDYAKVYSQLQSRGSLTINNLALVTMLPLSQVADILSEMMGLFEASVDTVSTGGVEVKYYRLTASPSVAAARTKGPLRE